MGNPGTETKNTCDKARQGKPPPNSASRATSPQGCTRRLGATTGDKEESIPSTSMETSEVDAGLLPIQVGITGSHDDQEILSPQWTECRCGGRVESPIEVCVLLCFIIPILGNRYGPGVNSLR